jgi:hypothetical protein
MSLLGCRRFLDLRLISAPAGEIVHPFGGDPNALACSRRPAEKKKLLNVHSTGAADFHGKFCSPCATLGRKVAI